jgi:hypothetical protein
MKILYCQYKSENNTDDTLSNYGINNCYFKSIYQKEVEKAEQWTKEALEKPIKVKDKYAVSNQLITDAHFKTKELEKLIQFSLQKDVLTKKYYTAKVLSKITFGKTRKKYKELRNQLKPIYSEIRKQSKFNIDFFK